MMAMVSRSTGRFYGKFRKMSSLPKPILRGHLKRDGIKMILGALTLGSITSLTYYVTIAIPRKNGYLNFLKDYDAEAHYKEMASWGYFQTANEIKKKSQA